LGITIKENYNAKKSENYQKNPKNYWKYSHTAQMPNQKKIHKIPKNTKRKFKINFKISHTPQRLYMDQINSNKYREFWIILWNFPISWNLSKIALKVNIGDKWMEGIQQILL
jgi:hypothetical protein